jgi:hypothetical protein
MAWQTQPGQQLPTQSIASFPGQPNTPLQGYPGMAYPQQSQIPPEVIAAAQAAGLGTPTREYRKGTAGSNPTTAGVQSLSACSTAHLPTLLLATTQVAL